MSFLAPIFLLALPLAALPIVVHLIRGRQRDTIEWGAMELLLQTVSKGRRFQRIEEWLLLALRTLAVLILVLALARPLVRSSWITGRPAQDVILVLDDSLSMSAADDESSPPLATLRTLATEAIGDMAATDQVQILLASGGGRWLTPQGVSADSAGRSRLIKLVDQIAASRGAADLPAAIARAVAVPPSDGASSRAVLIFSDAAETSWRPEAVAAWQQLEASARDDLPTRVVAIQCGTDSTRGNVAVVSIEAERPLARLDEKLPVTATVQNFGDEPTGPLRLRWFVGEEPAGESNLQQLAGNASSRSTIALPFDQPEVALVRCAIEGDDPLPMDDENFLAVEVSSSVRILVVHAPDGNPETIDAAELLAAALGFSDGEQQRWHSRFEPRTVDLAELADAELRDYRAVIITDLPALDPEDVDRLEGYVRAGGGVWVALGESLDRDDFNAHWYDDGAGLSPLAIDLLAVADPGREEPILLHPPDEVHPATRNLADTTRLDLEEVQIAQLWQFEEAPRETAASVLLATDDGRPFAVEEYVGQGRVIVQAAPMGLRWTNFALSRAYVVLVQDWLDYLTAPAADRYNIHPGDRLMAQAPSGFLGQTATLLDPLDRKTPLPVEGVGDVRSAIFTDLREPGAYTVSFGAEGQGEPIRFVASRDPSESDLTPLDDGQRAAIQSAANLQFVDEVPSLTVQESGTPALRSPWWPGLLAAAALLLVAELLVAHRAAQHRFAPLEGSFYSALLLAVALSSPVPF